MSIFTDIDLPNVNSKFNEDKREVLTGPIAGRYFKGIRAETNPLNNREEYSVELIFSKKDNDTLRAVLDAIDSTVMYQTDPKNHKNKEGKAAAKEARANYNEVIENFNSGKSNMTTIRENGKKIKVESGEYSIIEDGQRLFHFPIRDGDLIRKSITDEDGDKTSVLECEQEVGRGGEVKGCFVVRLKLDATRKNRDGTTSAQSPLIMNRARETLTLEDIEKFVSLDFGRFKFRPYCYVRNDGAGVTFYWVAAQHIMNGADRILPNGGGGDAADGFDEDFDDDEDDWDE
jgi:hypothetical protein